MASIREQILAALLQVVEPAVAAVGGRVLRGVASGVTREDGPTVVLVTESEAVGERCNDRVERQLTLRLVALARESAGEIGEVIADRLWVAAHRALWTDPNCAGLALGLRELDSDFESEDADALPVAWTTRYQITYRTLDRDPASLG